MNPNPRSVFTVVALMSALCASHSLAQDDPPPPTYPLVPFGWLSADPSVRTGAKPKLAWGVNYPSIVTDHITIIPPSTLVTKSVMDCEIRVIGSSVTRMAFGVPQYQYTNASISVDSGAYSTMWWERGNLVDPSVIVWSSTTMPVGRTLKFGGRYSANGNPNAAFGRGPWFDSDSATPNIRALVNGDTPPTTLPDIGTDSLETYLRPYLSPSGKLALGPMDVIIIMELTHTDESSSGYDMQDQILLLTFKPRAN